MRTLVRAVCILCLTAMAVACGGGGSGGGSTPAAPGGGNSGGNNGGNGSGNGSLPQSVVVASGAVTGADNQFSPADGDTASGGNGQTVDGVPCLPTMDVNDYHVHAFLGFVMNGSLQALPDGTGMNNPGDDTSGVVNTATCFYYLHTHDAAGVIHIESPSKASRSTTIFTLGTYLDIWGHTIGPDARIYTSGSKYQGQGDQSVSRSVYTQYTGDPRAIPLYGHEVIWVEYGPTFPSASQLPSVHFSY